LMKISEFLSEDEEVWQERFEDSWKQYEFTSLQQALQPFIEDRKWPQLVMEKLLEESNYKLIEIARFYQLDVTHILFDLLAKEPTKVELYLAIMGTNQRQYIQDLCTFAETNLPLPNLSEDEEQCLHCIIQDLHEYEDVGLSLLKAALQSDNRSLQ